jgi:hypothetical protein
LRRKIRKKTAKNPLPAAEQFSNSHTAVFNVSVDFF